MKTALCLINQEKLPRLAHVCDGLSLQEDLLQLVNRQIRKVHSCVFRGSKPARRRPVSIRVWAGFVISGGLLYDADRITEAMNVSDDELVDAQREMILDPFDPEVRAERPARTGSTSEQ